MSIDLFEYQNELNTGEVIALTPSNQAELKSNTTRGIWPRLWLYGNWTYMVGVAPATKVANVATGAEGSKLVVHEILNSQNQVIKWRFILLESSGSGKIKTSNGTVLQTLQPGQYSDILVNSSSEMTSTTTPATFNRNTTQGSEGIMDQVDQAIIEAGIEP